MEQAVRFLQRAVARPHLLKAVHRVTCPVLLLSVLRALPVAAAPAPALGAPPSLSPGRPHPLCVTIRPAAAANTCCHP